MNKILLVVLTILAGGAGFSILYILGVRDIGDLVGFVFGDGIVGAVLYFLLEQKEQRVLAPQIQVHVIDPESEQRGWVDIMVALDQVIREEQHLHDGTNRILEFRRIAFQPKDLEKIETDKNHREPNSEVESP